MTAPKNRKAQPRQILAAEAARLRKDGLLIRDIAGELGISRSYASELLSDPLGERSRERKSAYYGHCQECGALTSYNVGGSAELCRSCSQDASKIWTRDAIVLAIEEWADENGGIPPKVRDWRTPQPSRGPYPSVRTVIDHFGTWNAAIVQAGYDPHPRGPIAGFSRRLTDAQRAECARRYSRGESSVSIAHSLGCSYSTVLKWVRHQGLDVREGAFRRAA